jgi:hypothetical protein
MRTAAIVLVCVLAFAGCSFFLKGVPSDWTPETAPDCQPFIAVPIVDAVAGVAFTAWAVTECDEAKLTCPLGLVPGAAFLAAAVLGYFKVEKCRDAEQQFRGG